MIRKIVLTQEQGKAYETMLRKSNDNQSDPRSVREELVDKIIHGHKRWRDDYLPLNKLPLSDLLYIATGGHWEVQKTVRGVLEELREVYKNNHISSAGSALTIAIEKLEKEGLI